MNRGDEDMVGKWFDSNMIGEWLETEIKRLEKIIKNRHEFE